MAKVLFVHNGPLYRGPDGQMYGNSFTEAVKERYLLLGEHVTFLMREERLKGSTEGFSALRASDFDFVAVPDLMSPLARMLNHVRAMRTIEAAVRRSDVVVARIPSIVSRLAVGWARKLGKPYMIECVACNWDVLWNHNWKGKLTAPWYFLMQRRVVRDSPYVVYVTEEFLQRRYPTGGRHVAISNVQLRATSSEVLDRRLTRVRLSSGLGLPVKLVTIANVAVPYKGQADVIASLPGLIRDGIPVEYHLIGGGDQARLRALARRHGVEERVIFQGSKRHAEVFRLLDEMDIYVQPSRTEGLPRAVIEAMSRALPVVGARAGGIPELLESERTFRAGDYRGFVETFKKIIPFATQELDARRNFARAQAFREEVLLGRRQAFYLEFLNDNGFLSPEGGRLGVARKAQKKNDSATPASSVG